MSSSARSSLAGVSEELGAELVTDGSFAAVTKGSELHTEANAASDPNGNETNATTGWSGNAAITSDETVPNVGSYAIKMVSSANGHRMSKDIGTDWSLSLDKTYRLSFDIRHTGVALNDGDIDSKFSDGEGLTTNLTIVTTLLKAETTYQTISYDFTYTANHQYFGFRENTVDSDGGVYVDNLSCKEVTFTNWTGGTGWAPQATAGVLTGKAQKVAGTASDLEQDVSAAAKAVYRVVHTVTRTAGSETPKVGGASGAAHASAATFTDNIGPATTTGNLQFSADATFAGTIDDVSAKEIVRRAIPD